MKITKRMKQVIENHQEVFIVLNIPIKFRLGQKYNQYSDHSEKLSHKYDGCLLGGGYGGGNFYDQEFLFDESTKNLKSALKFLKEYRRRYPRHTVQYFAIKEIGSTRTYTPREVNRMIKTGTI